MRIASIVIENFRAIRFLKLDDLPDAIVIAGPNGCGKSSIFDAIRLLKSAYGQYHQNEYQSWFNEFQINFQKIREESHRFFHDPGKPLSIKVEFEFSEVELDYLKSNARELYLQLNWAQFRGMGPSRFGWQVVHPTMRRAQGPVVEHQTAELMAALMEVVGQKRHVAELRMGPGEDPVVTPSPVVELVFSMYKPQSVGVIDYHGANRAFAREQVGGIDLRIENKADKKVQHALYETQNKYTGVKTEMAQSYIRQVLAREAGVSLGEEHDLKHTLDELFDVFFPGKKFLGVTPTRDGGLEFPVRLENGRVHDINELSSGEKEVLMGYLRLRNGAPINSIILLDEPELHLNPRLIRGLPSFYQKHIGGAFGNQLWLVTHSDALLREAVDEPSYVVYQMQPSYVCPVGVSQAEKVSGVAEIERSILDLVGDLSTYSPRSKVVFVEGENSEDDLNLIHELFPDVCERVNLVSAGSKKRVGAIHHLLSKASAAGGGSARYYSIVDKDFDVERLTNIENRFVWDVYHIENYLLVPKYIRAAMKSLNIGGGVPSEEDIASGLKLCAAKTMGELVRIRLESYVNAALVGALSTGFDPKISVTAGFRMAAERSLQRLNDVLEGDLTFDRISRQEDLVRGELQEALNSDRWVEKFRGRDVLSAFCGMYGSKLEVPYKKFRNLIVNRMREDGYKPTGMQQVLEQILAH